jgi:hypothetical protein
MAGSFAVQQFGGFRVKKNLTEINHKVSLLAKRFVAPFGVRS